MELYCAISHSGLFIMCCMFLTQEKEWFATKVCNHHKWHHSVTPPYAADGADARWEPVCGGDTGG